LEKPSFYPEMSQKFKLNSKNHIRFKTEVDESNSKSKFNFSGVRMSEKADKAEKLLPNFQDTKRSDKQNPYLNVSHFEPKKEAVKKLHLNHELCTFSST
jgi:hypothetical protein